MSKMQEKEIIAWRCSRCGVATLPEDIVSRAMTSVSGFDVVSVAHCPCGNSALLSWSLEDWRQLHHMRKVQLANQQKVVDHLKATEVGRKVAEFRDGLEAGDTLADWGLI